MCVETTMNRYGDGGAGLYYADGVSQYCRPYLEVVLVANALNNTVVAFNLPG